MVQNGAVSLAMVTIPAGASVLKDERTNRCWTVDLPSFRIGKYAVTRREYLALVHGHVVDGEDANKPMTDVSWLDAVSYCNLVSNSAGLQACYSWDAAGEVVCDWTANGYRLPTEAEWEFACRAGSSEVRYGELDDIAWYRDNSGERLHEVGQKRPNGWGLHDMLGNAWEWCWDIYDARVYGAYRVFRGGGWCDPPRGCRASCRRKSHPTYRIDDLGFRLARCASAALA